MKKLTQGLFIAALLLGTSACSKNQTTSVSDADTIYFTVGSQEITKGDIYNYMKMQNLDTGIIAMAEQDLVEQLVPVTDEMNQQVDEYIQADKELYGEDTFLQMINYYGFADEQAYRDAYLTNIRMTELTQQYIEENWDSMMEQYKPVQANVLAFTDTSTTSIDSEEETSEETQSQAEINANEALAALKDGSKDLDTVILDYELSASSEPTIYLSNNTSLPSGILTYIQTNSVGYCNEVIFDDSTGTPTYYIVNIVENDPTVFKDDVLTSLSSVGDVATEADQYFLRSNNFYVYDQLVLEAIQTNYNGYLTDEQQAPVATTTAE